MLLKHDYRIILASKSPRRSQLLSQAGLPFIIKTNEVVEDYPAELSTEEVPVFLAQKKAQAAIGFLERENDVILAADSVVILDGEIYGKPKDAKMAKAMLRKLSGRTHRVITGVCLLTRDSQVAFGDLTTVKFATLTDAEIAFYVDTYQPFDKAGSYAIQEWIGLCKIEKIEGTYANVMGLPVQRVWESLEKIIRSA